MHLCWRVCWLLPVEEVLNKVTSLFLYLQIVCRLFTSCMYSLQTYISFWRKPARLLPREITLRTRSRTSSPATPQGSTPTGRSLEQSNFSLFMNGMSAIYILYILFTPHLRFISKETCKIHCCGKLRYEPRSRTSWPATPVGRRLKLSKFSRLAFEQGRYGYFLFLLWKVI